MVPLQPNPTGFKHLFHPLFLSACTLFFGRPDFAFLVESGFVAQPKITKLGFIIIITNQDGSRIHPEVFKAFKIRSHSKRLQHLIAKTFDFPVREAILFLQPSEPSISLPPPPSKRMRKDSRKRARSKKHSDYRFQSRFFSPGMDSNTFSMDEYNLRTLNGVHSYFKDVLQAFTRFAASMTRENEHRLRHGSYNKPACILHVLDFFSILQGQKSSSMLLVDLVSKAWGHFNPEFSSSSDYGFQAADTNPTMSNMLKFVMFCVSLPFMKRSTSWLESKTFFENASNSFFKKGGISDQGDFISISTGFFTWLFKAGSEAFQEGSFAPFFREKEGYATWYDASSAVVREYTSVGFDIEISDYLEKLERNIEQGERILENARKIQDRNLGPITKLMSELKEIQYSEKLHDLARSSRPTPFFMGVYGAPKTGKTFLVDELLVVYHKIAKITYESRFKYVRSSTDKFESGLRTWHKAIIVDDVGMLNEKSSPDVAASGPSFIMEVANATVSSSNQAIFAIKVKFLPDPMLSSRLQTTLSSVIEEFSNTLKRT